MKQKNLINIKLKKEDNSKNFKGYEKLSSNEEKRLLESINSEFGNKSKIKNILKL